MSPKPADKKLLPVRTAVILAFALLVAIGAGTLTYLQAKSLPSAVLAACAAWAAAVVLFNTLIDAR